MDTGFPQYSRNAQKGEYGVDLISRIVNKELGWLFKRNHQEHDFGIDGQIEIVTASGHVTGQMLAVQIKYGKSFFQEKNKWGYVYRGDVKHFNYLYNYPIPVLIIICHPQSETCYWVRFEPDQTQRSGAGWKITIPFENTLIESKEVIEGFLPPLENGLKHLQEYWSINNLILESSFVYYVIGRDDVITRSTSNARDFFDRLCSTKEIAHHCQGKVEIGFHGYDNDPRELFEIEEVRMYIKLLDSVLPELLFFVRTDPPTYTLATFVFCQINVSWVGERSTIHKKAQITFENIEAAEFLMRHWEGLNRMTEWLGLPEEENKRISFAVMRTLGICPQEDLEPEVNTP